MKKEESKVFFLLWSESTNVMPDSTLSIYGMTVCEIQIKNIPLLLPSIHYLQQEGTGRQVFVPRKRLQRLGVDGGKSTRIKYKW